MVKITTDSCSDISQEFIKKHNIGVISLSVILGDQEYDGMQVQPKDIFEFVSKTSTLPKTAARSEFEYKEFFEKFVGEGDSVVHISLSGALSATCQSAINAGKQFKKGEVYVVDSKSLSSGIGLLVLMATDMAEKGISAQDIYKAILKQVDYNQTSFIVDTLDYLYKGGRCSGVAKFGANLLHIKPRLEIIDGKIENTGKYLGGIKNVLKKYIDDILAQNPKMINNVCFVTHSCPEGSTLPNEIAEYVRSKGIFDEVIIQTAGAVITSHCGPNTLGILYLKDMLEK